MRYPGQVGLLVLVSVFFSFPGKAAAQFRGFGGAYFGNFGGFGYGNYGLGYGGLYGGYPGFGAYGGIGVVPGMSYGYGPAWSYGSPYYLGGYGRITPIMTPGFGASEPLRARPYVYPAIADPPPAIIAAALDNGDHERARIVIHVPTASAEVLLDGAATRETGMDREFITPRLNPKSTYSMEVEMSWRDGTGILRIARRQLTLQAGQSYNVNLRDD